MDAGILRALQTVRANPYVNYVGLGLAGLVSQKEQHDPVTGKALRKTKLQLVRISAAVCGIELCYAAETAFVSPILLKLGVPTTLMTMVWCLSPLLGFFLVPIMGSLSDRCRFRIGRRRPFIILMALGIVIGLALVPNGESLGRFLGDSSNNTKLGHPKHAANRDGMGKDGEDGFGDGGGRTWITNKTNYGFENKTRYLVPVSLAASKSYIDFSNAFGLDKQALGSTSHHALTKRNKLYRGNKRAAGGNLTAPKSSTKSSTASSPLSFEIPSHGVRGILLTILGVAMLDFNCDACQSPSRAYLLDVSVPEDHQTGLTTFTVMAGLGGTVGYLMGGIDWNSTSFGEALGGHIRVVFTIVLVCFIVCIISTLTSFRETPLDELNIRNEDVVKKIKKKKGKKKYQRFTNEDSWSEEDEEEEEGEKVEESIERMKKATRENSFTFYGSLSDPKQCPTFTHPLDKQNSFLPSQKVQNGTSKSGQTENSIPNQNGCWKAPLMNGSSRKSLSDREIGNSHNMASVNSRGVHSDANGAPQSYAQTSDEVNMYSKSANNMRTLTDDANLPREVDDIKLLDVSTDVTLRTYLKSIVRMPSSLWVLCLSNLFCWMSLLCYSLYFTDFVGQSVLGGDPSAPIGSDLHNRYDAGVRLGSWGMSLYSLSCSCYSLVIERLVHRFRAKPVYVYGQLAYSVGMVGMALTRTKWAVLLFSPTAGIMYATLFTMPYMLVAHYHTRGLFSHATTSGMVEDGVSPPATQVRGLGTDVAIVSSMVFLAQFLLSVAMGTIMAAIGSTVTVLVASSILSFCGALSALKVTYLDL